MAPTYSSAAGARLLLIAAGLEALRLALRLQGPICLGLALLSVRFIAGLTWSEIGLHRWREWNATEKSYVVQVVLIACVVFPIVLGPRLRTALASSSSSSTVFVPYFFFGFYQEVVCRGMLQTELVRRWGAAGGILASNSLYTFGSLHYYYFFSRASLAVPMFAAIFAMGLLFAIVFRRSGNLWIVGVMHAIGNSLIVGSLGAVR